MSPLGPPEAAGDDPVWIADQSGSTPCDTDDGPLLILRDGIEELSCAAYGGRDRSVSITCVVNVWCETDGSRSYVALSGSSVVALAKRWNLPIVLRTSGIDLRWHPTGDSEAVRREVEAARDDAVNASALAHNARREAEKAAQQADTAARRLSLALSAL